MILAEPAPSQGDVHFRIFGIPVRVHPFFWVISLLIGLQGDPLPVKVLLWVASMVVSILIHEIGHALIQRHFGGRPRIVLHGMGGLAICGDCDRSTRSQILISLAGPGAGFALAGATLLLLGISGHQPGIAVDPSAQVSPPWISIFGAKFHWLNFSTPAMNMVVADLLWINILWGGGNLLPIYPLDGGQVARELCLLGNPRTGIILSLRISMIAAIAMVLVGLSSESLYVAIMFGYFAYSSYKTLDAYRASLW